MNESRSCIDLIITHQPDFLVDYGLHPSLYKACHQEITYGKINLSVPPPPSYKRRVWEYKNSNIAEIPHALQNIDRDEKFQNLDVDSVTDAFCSTLMIVVSTLFPEYFYTRKFHNLKISINNQEKLWTSELTFFCNLTFFPY